jgi:hypothetical protein
MTARRWSPPQPLRLPEVTLLAERIETLPERERPFARRLIGQAMSRGTLTDKQLRAVAGLVVASVKRATREARIG